MSAMFPNLRYVWVKELHKDYEHVHFHVLYFNLPWNTHEQMNNAWPYGFVSVERVRGGTKDLQKCAGYMAKYLGKQNPEDTEKKLYVPSQNLALPITYYHPLDVAVLLQECEGVTPYAKTLKNPYTGENITYERYVITEKPPVGSCSVHVGM